MALVESENDSWPFIRLRTVCAVCQGEKPAGKIVCDECRRTRTFLSMTAELKRAEMSMRWNASRLPDTPASRRQTDPKLGPCPKCHARDAVFMRFEAPGKIVGWAITPRVLYYVLCNGCGYQTIPVNSKRAAASLWLLPVNETVRY